METTFFTAFGHAMMDSLGALAIPMLLGLVLMLWKHTPKTPQPPTEADFNLDNKSIAERMLDPSDVLYHESEPSYM